MRRGHSESEWSGVDTRDFYSEHLLFPVPASHWNVLPALVLSPGDG